MSKIINVTKSSMPPFEEYIEELRPVWESRWLSNRGNASKKFEEDLKKYLDVEQVYCFANGHVALEVAINGLFLPKGGEVITTPYTHISTTHSIIRNGLIYENADVPIAKYASDHVLTLPLYADLSLEDVDRICKVILDAWIW